MEDLALCTVSLSIPDESVHALHLRSDQPELLAAELRLAAAVKLYEVGRLSSGAAAGLAGLPLSVFLAKLADYGVDAFRLSAEQLAEERRLV
jgi:predicted HTH domain antitoxin